MKVLIYGHNIFAIDMLWGFLQIGCDAQIIHPASVEQIDKMFADINPDLLITLGSPLEFDPSILQYIGKRISSSMNYVHWDTDGISNTFYQTTSGEGIEMDLILKILLDLDVPIECFNGYLPYEKTCEIYNSSFINLVTQNHKNTITKRTFEIIGSGGFMISSDNIAIRQLFIPGKDLEVSSSPEQTLELVQYYANNLDAYNKIRENALISAQNNTYKQRVEYIISKLNYK